MELGLCILSLEELATCTLGDVPDSQSLAYMELCAPFTYELDTTFVDVLNVPALLQPTDHVKAEEPFVAVEVSAQGPEALSIDRLAIAEGIAQPVNESGTDRLNKGNE